jgi:hypothetical protein
MLSYMSNMSDDERREEERRQERMASFPARRRSEEEYLRHVESLAKAVSHAALEERGVASFRVEEAETPLQRAIAELSCNLRSYHYEGDGCVDGH